MQKEQSIIKKTESAVDDLLDLWHRRKPVCVIVLAVIVIPSCLSLYLQFVAVPKLREQVETLQAAKREAEQKRDKAELQLAPFLAAADRRFPETPVEKRLDLLLAKFDKAVTDAQSAALKVSQLSKPARLSLFLNGQTIISDQCVIVRKNDNQYRLNFCVRNTGDGSADDARFTLSYPLAFTNLIIPIDWHAAPSQALIDGTLVDVPVFHAISTTAQQTIHPNSFFTCSPLVLQSGDRLAITQLVVAVATARDTEQCKHVFKIVLLSEEGKKE